MSTISIAGLNKAEVLAALYNASRPQGMGFRQYEPKPMTSDEAAKLLMHRQSFDYLNGRVMKIDIGPDEVYTSGYNMDNGQGAAEAAISALYASGDVNSAKIKEAHEAGTKAAEKELAAAGAQGISIVLLQTFLDEALKQSEV